VWSTEPRNALRGTPEGIRAPASCTPRPVRAALLWVARLEAIAARSARGCRLPVPSPASRSVSARRVPGMWSTGRHRASPPAHAGVPIARPPAGQRRGCLSVVPGAGKGPADMTAISQIRLPTAVVRLRLIADRGRDANPQIPSAPRGRAHSRDRRDAVDPWLPLSRVCQVQNPRSGPSAILDGLDRPPSVASRRGTQKRYSEIACKWSIP
jgi:hypothetical protein